MNKHASVNSYFGTLILLLLATLGCGGCFTGRDVVRVFSSGTHSREDWDGDPVALATVKTIMVVPFANGSPGSGFDSMLFSTKLANEIRSRGKFKVIYPQVVAQQTMKKNRLVERHNSEYRYRKLAGTTLAEERVAQTEGANQNLRENISSEEDTLRRQFDPVHNMNDAVKLGRLMHADAVIIGRVDDYDPYTRPRLSVNMAVLATGVGETMARELAGLAQWGVPRQTRSSRGVIWSVQQNIDSRAGNIGADLQIYAYTHHTEENATNMGLYRKSPRMFYSFVGAKLTSLLLAARKEAIVEAEKRALAVAKERQASQVAVKNRIRKLVNPEIYLPDAEDVTAMQNRERRELGWRPDLYNQSHPKKAASLYAPK